MDRMLHSHLICFVVLTADLVVVALVKVEAVNFVAAVVVVGIYC